MKEPARFDPYVVETLMARPGRPRPAAVRVPRLPVSRARGSEGARTRRPREPAEHRGRDRAVEDRRAARSADARPAAAGARRQNIADGGAGRTSCCGRGLGARLIRYRRDGGASLSRGGVDRGRLPRLQAGSHAHGDRRRRRRPADPRLVRLLRQRAQLSWWARVRLRARTRAPLRGEGARTPV